MWEFHHLVYLNKLHDHEFCPHNLFLSSSAEVEHFSNWNARVSFDNALDLIFLANLCAQEMSKQTK